ncbi:MAG: TetR/AcrR family transcriptional regulator [Micromonosporaceae bacterium]
MLDSAARIFSRHGYHAAGVDEIADGAGISKPMIYLYFGSKEELFVAVVQREAERLNEMIDQAVAGARSPYQQLRGALEAFLIFVAERRDGWSVLYRQARSQGDLFADGVNAIRDRTVRVVASLLGRAVSEAGAALPPQQELVATGHAIVGGCEAIADWLVEQTDVAPEMAARRAVELAWNGLSGLFQPALADPEPSR